MKRVLLCLDAFKEEYLGYAPFLQKFYKNGTHGLLEPTFGYSAMASAFTGLLPDQHGILAQYKFSQTFRNGRFNLSLFDDLFSNNFIRFSANVVANLAYEIPFRQKIKSFYNIPFQFLRHFDAVSPYSYFDSSVLEGKTIIARLLKKGLKVAGYAWPYEMKNGRARLDFNNLSYRSEGTDEKSFGKIMKLLKGDYNFYYFQFYGADAIAHRFGTKSERLKEEIGKIDSYAAEITKKCDSLLIFSDHGMIDIRNTVNIWEWIRNSGLLFGKDYLMFLDSTLARFEILSAEGKIIFNYLKGLKGGKLVSLQEFSKWRIPAGFGKLIWLANPGWLICPNFYAQKPVKAMHGYSPEIKSNMGIYAFGGVRQQKNIGIWEIIKYLIPD